MITAYFFDGEGQSYKDTFRSVEEAERFAKNHGLELWHIKH